MASAGYLRSQRSTQFKFYILEIGGDGGSRARPSRFQRLGWDVGRRMIEFEQHGASRAKYGGALLTKLSEDLNGRFGRGFSVDNLETMRLFYLTYPEKQIFETLSRNFDFTALAKRFPLPWSHYVLLLRRVKQGDARSFYEMEAIRGGWTVRQLDRQIETQFFERTALSLNKKSMLTKGMKKQPSDHVSVEE
jgi:hypothetical protein